jgi:hypothetical protein
MTKLEAKAVELLIEALGIPENEVSSHPFYLHVQRLERKSKRARLVYPLVYLALGGVLILALNIYDPSISDDWEKLFGAVLGVFSALLAFWKPTVLLTQEDCRTLLKEKKITGGDLREFNDLLGLPDKKVDDVLKLVGAIASFAAIYLLMER